jgi:2-oxoglutarate dehydrogenase E1 component
MFDEFGINAGYVEELHARWRQAPQAVDEDWRVFFEALGEGRPATPPFSQQSAPANGTSSAPLASAATAAAPLAAKTNGNGSGAAAHGTNGNGAAAAAAAASPVLARVSLMPQGGAMKDELIAAAGVQGRVYQLVNAYRVRGHLFARLDPLAPSDGPAGTDAPPELNLGNFGLSAADLESTFATEGMTGLPERATLRQIIAHLTETYCRSIGVEYTHIEDPTMRQWLQDAMESSQNHASLDREDLVRVLTKLTDAEIFEQFIHRNYVGSKRFSLEGAESMIALLDLLVEEAGAQGAQEVVLGMAHRGRLNVLVNIMGKNVREIFAAFDDKQPERFLGAGDVKYHLGYSSDRVTASGHTVHLSLAFNPSHLEWVNPVVEGRVRAKQDRQKRRGVVPLLIHGDAAFMGQGVVPETLNLAGLEGYTTGGTIHVVVNNQIGFTTIPEDSRSTRYCTDITRMMKVPVFHVNGEDPEAVIQVTRLATEYRQRFGKDVVIDMYCYRKYGHNEGDEPTFTQPLMYSLIRKKPSVRQMYVDRLVDAAQITRERAAAIEQERKAILEQAYNEAKAGDYLRKPNAMEGVWTPYFGGPDRLVPEANTGVPKERLMALLGELTTIPETFHANPKALKIIEQRRERATAHGTLIWETAEHLAFATLLTEGKPVRLSGQDARRGTFSHRHAVLFDHETGERHTPLSALKDAAPFEVWDSPLSEAGVLGFEYGYSLDRPEGLVIWEAQFGDFANSAQVIIDQFIVSAEDKWLRLSGLVLLLPHGYEGQGPEHSSARVERFLQMSAEDNIQVCNLTTPANLFHALRRQVLRPWRKPLVIFTPKSLLRHPEAFSTFEELSNGAFRRVIPDDGAQPREVTKILLCTGKVFYDLDAARKKQGRTDVAIIRLEQIYPLNDAIVDALAPYKDGTPLVWVQEEPKNSGPWYFINANLRQHIGERLPLSVVSRAGSASPATGSKASHELEQKLLIEQAFAR